MRMIRQSPSFVSELAEFLASEPTAQQLLDYRPSKTVQRQACRLLEKQNEGPISPDEHRELDEFAYAERLMRLIKARVRLAQKK